MTGYISLSFWNLMEDLTVIFWEITYIISTRHLPYFIFRWLPVQNEQLAAGHPCNWARPASTPQVDFQLLDWGQLPFSVGSHRNPTGMLYSSKCWTASTGYPGDRAKWVCCGFVVEDWNLSDGQTDTIHHCSVQDHRADFGLRKERSGSQDWLGHMLDWGVVQNSFWVWEILHDCFTDGSKDCSSRGSTRAPSETYFNVGHKWGTAFRPWEKSSNWWAGSQQNEGEDRSGKTGSSRGRRWWAKPSIRVWHQQEVTWRTDWWSA